MFSPGIVWCLTCVPSSPSICCLLLCCGLGTALASQQSRPEHVTAPRGRTVEGLYVCFLQRNLLLPGLSVCTWVCVSLLTSGEHSRASMTSPAGGITVQLSEWGVGVQMTREDERPPVCTSSADWTDPHARFRPACGIRQHDKRRGAKIEPAWPGCSHPE